MNSTSDRRTTRTETVLKNALFELLKHKNFDEITVTEISELADINRGTFYLHYQDIYDFYNNLENNFLIEFSNYVKIYLDNNKPSIYDFFLKLYEYFFAKRTDLKTFIATNHSKIVDKIIEMRYPETFKHWETNYTSGEENDYLYYYASISSAFKSLIYFWHKNDFDKSPVEMALITKNILLFYGYRHI